MSETKHTPGPWEQQGLSIFQGRTDTWVGKAVEMIGGVGREESEANACLIAAAPELLEACKALRELDPPCPFMAADGRVKEWFDIWKKTIAAIAKAEGR